MHDAFPSETLIRLRELKARYDPDDVFNQNFPIPHAEVVVYASLGQGIGRCAVTTGVAREAVDLDRVA
jgi:hypothetical protein